MTFKTFLVAKMIAMKGKEMNKRREMNKINYFI